MSIASHSPPATPRQTVAVENRDDTPRPRTRLPEGSPTIEGEKAEPPLSSLSAKNEDIQELGHVPGTCKTEVTVSDAISQAEKENREVKEDAVERSNSDQELPSFDWSDFEQRYRIDLEAANDVEDKLRLEFERLCESFSFWATASSTRDNQRAAKRLKTRERYVHLSEAALDDKKKHYEEVVEAFKRALELLKLTSGRR